MEFTVDYKVYENGKSAPAYTIDSDLNGEVSLQEFIDFTRNSLIIIADQALREEQAKGFDKEPVVAVDGRIGKPVSAVKPFGNIVFTARQQAADFLLEIYDAIVAKSPRDTGLYRSGNLVFLNGTQVAANQEQFSTWVASAPQIADNDVIRFVNILPYARKMERLGVTSSGQKGRRVKSRDKQQRAGPTIRAPNGAYFLASKVISKKYKFNSKIKFEFLPGTSLGIQNLPSASGGKQLRRTYKSTGAPYLYPCIKVTISGEGIK